MRSAVIALCLLAGVNMSGNAKQRGESRFFVTTVHECAVGFLKVASGRSRPDDPDWRGAKRFETIPRDDRWIACYLFFSPDDDITNLVYRTENGLHRCDPLQLALRMPNSPLYTVCIIDRETPGVLQWRAGRTECSLALSSILPNLESLPLSWTSLPDSTTRVTLFDIPGRFNGKPGPR